MNARRITPSSPIKLPSGSRKSAITLRSIELPTFMFASTHITSPAGAATATARSRTKKTFSFTVCHIIFKNCGFLYGGSSRTKEDASPFRIVFVKANEDSIVAAIDEAIKLSNTKADSKLFFVKNIAVIAINKGNTPPTLRKLLRACRRINGWNGFIHRT